MDKVNEWLAEVIPKVIESEMPIVDIELVPSEFATTYETNVVQVKLSNGDQYKYFVKKIADVGKKWTKSPKHDLRRIYRCEVCAYRDVLSKRKLSTATYYASIFDEITHEGYLLLELVPGFPLNSFKEFDYWLAGTRCLAKMHAEYSGCTQDLMAFSNLERYDEDYYHRIAVSAEQAFREVPHLAKRFSKILDQNEKAVRLMSKLPVTLVTGKCQPSSILVDAGQTPPRICIVDWKWSGIGWGLLDLEYLISSKYRKISKDTNRKLVETRKFIETYCREFNSSSAGFLEIKDVEATIPLFSLQRIIANFAEKLSYRDPTSDRVMRKLARAEFLVSQIR